MLKRRTNGRNERTGTNNMEQKNIILVGGGGHCKYVIDVAESVVFNIVGICINQFKPLTTHICVKI